jgi:hypothetical protein
MISFPSLGFQPEAFLKYRREPVPAVDLLEDQFPEALELALVPGRGILKVLGQ